MNPRQALMRLQWHIFDAGPPWYWPSAKCPADMRTLRRAAASARWRRLPPVLRPLGAIAVTLGMLAVKPSLAWSISKAYGGARHGLRLATRLYGTCLRHGLEPFDQLSCGVHTDRNVHPDQILNLSDATFAVMAITPPAMRTFAHDKKAFAAHCRAQINAKTLQIPRIHALIGPVEPPDEQPQALPRRDLVAKPVKGSQGKGITLWRYGPDGYREERDAIDGGEAGPFDSAGLAQHLTCLAAKAPGGLLVQDWIAPHPDLSDLSDPAAPVVRVNTGLYPDGRAVVLSVLMQQAAPGRIKTQNGKVRDIDPATGRLRPIPEHVIDGPMDYMLLRGAEHDHCALPHWPGLIDQLKALHLSLPERTPVMGWDVLLGPDSAVLLEANATITPYMDQLIGLGPAAETAWSPLLAAWVACRD